MKTKLFMMLVFLCSLLQAQISAVAQSVSSNQLVHGWNQLGSTQFTSFAKNADLAIDSNGDTFVAYSDILDNNYLKVMKYNGTSWVNYGTTATSIGVSLFTLEINPSTNEPWIAYENGDNYLEIIKFNGSTWDSENIISKTPVDKIQMKFDSSGKAVVASTTNSGYNGELILYSNYSGTWQNAFSSTTNVMGTVDLISATSLKCVLSSIYNGSLRYTMQTLTYNGTAWYSGYGLGYYYNVYPYRGVVATASDFLFLDQTNEMRKATTYYFNTNIDGFSNLGSINYLISSTDNLNYLFYIDDNSEIRTKKSLSTNVDPGIDMSSANNVFAKAKYNETTGNIHAVYNDGEKCSVKIYKTVAPLVKYYINANVSGGDGSGDSWANAMADIQDALSVAGSVTEEIWIATGTYSPGLAVSDAFNLKIIGLSVYGGFDGTETSISERDITANPTILSGDVSGDDSGVDYTGFNRTDNNRQVVKLNASNITIDGLKIEDGHSLNTSYPGSAISIGSTIVNPIIRNCEFNNNVSINGGVRGYFSVDTEITIENCKFNGNVGRYASGLYILFNDNTTATLNITNTLFTNNITKNYGTNDGYTGSALWARAEQPGSTLTTNIVNSTFANNTDIGTISTSTSRGTLTLSQNLGTHNATISNSIFYGNTGASSVTTPAITQGHLSAANQIVVYNSIDEDSFSNIVYKSNTSNSDPLFTDAANGDFTLQTGSPAIDAGDNTKIPTGITADLLGYSRIFNTTVDMGVYEFGSSPTLSNTEIKNDINEVKVSPNPASSYLNIETELGLNNIEVYNLQGTRVLTSKNNTIDVSNFVAGVYIIKVELTTGSSVVKRFVKQ